MKNIIVILLSLLAFNSGAQAIDTPAFHQDSVFYRHRYANIVLTDTANRVSNFPCRIHLSVCDEMDGASVGANITARIITVSSRNPSNIFNTSIPLSGDYYTSWDSDSYLYEYVKTVLATQRIFISWTQ